MPTTHIHPKADICIQHDVIAVEIREMKRFETFQNVSFGHRKSQTFTHEWHACQSLVRYGMIENDELTITRNQHPHQQSIVAVKYLPARHRYRRSIIRRMTSIGTGAHAAMTMDR